MRRGGWELTTRCDSPSTGLYFVAIHRFWHYDFLSVPTGKYDILLAASRDGANNLTLLGGRTSWLRPTLEGTKGSRRLWLAPPGPVLYGNEELYFVSRTNTAEDSGWRTIDTQSPHGQWESEIAVGRLRRDGLVSLDAPYTRRTDASVLQTKPFVFSGRQLLVNVDPGGGGSLTIEVREHDATGPVLLTSVPLVYNGVDIPVLFGAASPLMGGNATASAITVFAGVPIQLTMVLRDCRLYGFRFAD